MSQKPGPVEGYQLIDQLGSGGFGAVYRARQLATGDLVALKLLPPVVAEEALSRFKREIRLLKLLDSPHIVRYLDGKIDGPRPYLAMQLIKGRTLRETLEKERASLGDEAAPTPLPRSLEWARDLAAGLAVAHGQGIIHRDLKPTNVIQDDQGRLVLIDLGLARADNSASVSLTRTGFMIGTLRYFAPEQYGGGELSARTDVYQWGLLVYEMLTGDIPHPMEDPMASLIARFEDGAPPLRFTDWNLQQLADLACTSLDPDPSGRPADGAVLLEKLDRILLGGDETPSTDLEPGSRVGTFEVVRRLGEGGMGVVYEGRNPTTGERCALKVIHPRVSSDIKVMRRFQRETKLLVGMMSQRVVRVLDFGDSNRGPYLAMEFMQGDTLASALEREGRFPLGRALAIFQDLTEGLKDLHARDVVHRDIKPANAMLDPRGRLRILDLGLAKDLNATTLTGTGASLGSPLYIPPEMLKGGMSTPSADVFQAGLILYEMLTGRRDFRSESAPVTLRGVLMGDPNLQSDRGLELVNAVLETFRRCADPDPTRRIASGATLYKEAQRLKADHDALQTPARAEARPVRVTRKSAPSSEAEEAPAEPQRGQSLAILQQIVTILVVLGVLGVAAAVLWITPEILRRLPH